MKNFVADESVDFGIVEGLRKQGYKVYSILESNPSVDDEEVLRIANKHQAILITEDKDFGELVFRLQKKNRGIFLIRLSGMISEEKVKIVLNTLNQHIQALKDSFSVLSKKKLRIKTVHKKSL